MGWPVKFCALFMFIVHFVQADQFRTGDHFSSPLVVNVETQGRSKYIVELL